MLRLRDVQIECTVSVNDARLFGWRKYEQETGE